MASYGALPANAVDPNSVPQLNSILGYIKEGLNATLDPRVSNDVRREALTYLESHKTQPDAPQHGFLLAYDSDQNDAVRYYGLQLLEYAVRVRWEGYTTDQTEQLRLWVKCLADSLRAQDSALLRNKTAQLWTEVAKKSWGESWMSMDEELVNLWDRSVEQKGMASKLFVLSMWETLGEEILNPDDTLPSARLKALGGFLHDAMAPAGMYAANEAARGARLVVRYQGEGWMARIFNFFAICVQQMQAGAPPEELQLMQSCAIKALDVLRPTISWANIKASEEVRSVDYLFLALDHFGSSSASNVALQIATVDTLQALLHQPNNYKLSPDIFKNVLKQSMRLDRVAKIKQIFQHVQAGPGEDDEKHALQIKIAEVLATFADVLPVFPNLVDTETELPSVLDLLLTVLQNKSLTVSIPVLASWAKLINLQTGHGVNADHDALFAPTIIHNVPATFEPVLRLCAERVVRYDALSDGFQDEILSYLEDDFDTRVERDAFTSNYRIYCMEAVRQTAKSRPLATLKFALGELVAMLTNGPYVAARGFNSATFSKHSLPTLKFEAIWTVVTSALRGFSSWRTAVAKLSTDVSWYKSAQNELSESNHLLEEMCQFLMSMPNENPQVACDILELLTHTVMILKSPPKTLVLNIVQHILSVEMRDNPAHTAYSEVVGAFESLQAFEIQRIALTFPDILSKVWPEMETRINALAEKHKDDQKQYWGYKAILLIIIQRARGLEDDARANQLRMMLRPIYDAWTSPELNRTVSSFDEFMSRMGFDSVKQYWYDAKFAQVEDWAAQPLDAHGKEVQRHVKEKADQLPLRMVKAMLMAMVQHIKSGSDEYEVACALWADLIPVILGPLLLLIEQAQAFHNLSRHGPDLPSDLQFIIKRTLQDRFWQSGISNESKQEFYARISGSKTSYEGFASTVRGAVRNIREQSYGVISWMMKFDEQFFGLPNLAGAMAQSLFTDAGYLSAAHWSPLIELVTGLAHCCPPHHRQNFLPPLLRGLFVSIDSKIVTEWQAISQVADQNRGEDEDSLGDEMRTESILRQLTFSAVSFVYNLLSDFGSSRTTSPNKPVARPTPADIVLGDISVLEPAMLFCVHALGLRDLRSSTKICDVFKLLVPRFAPSTETDSSTPADVLPRVRNFLCTDALMACIDCLHQPYFAEKQRDLALVIALILHHYAASTPAASEVLMQLPEMSAEKVERAVRKVVESTNERTQRKLVLELLDGVRGVAIHEMGRLPRPTPAKVSVVKEKYKQPPPVQKRVGNGEEAFEGLEGLFGDGIE